MQTNKIKSITTEEVFNLDVYNLELESLEEKDDLYYYDVESRLIHHNCLRKDYGMINEHFPHTDLLLQAYKINEFMPKFLVDNAGDLTDKTVVVLGYTFKQDSDDTRDSLSPKLIRYIKRKVPKKLYIVEPNLPAGEVNDELNNMEFINTRIEDILRADAVPGVCNNFMVFIATNHTEFHGNWGPYYELYKLSHASGNAICDIWGVTYGLKPNS